MVQELMFSTLSILYIKKGEITAIVGESGSGKTTLISLLQNLYPLQSGHIRIGRYDLRHLTNQSLRQIVSVVPQRIDLFAGNVVDNIAVGEFNPDMGRVIEVCEKLGMTKFIEQLPYGFNTYLGENGASLSGGQQQRTSGMTAVKSITSKRFNKFPNSSGCPLVNFIFHHPRIIFSDCSSRNFYFFANGFSQNIGFNPTETG